MRSSLSLREEGIWSKNPSSQLIICINRNANISNNLLGFLYITFRWQPSAQCPADHFKVFKEGVRCCFWGPASKATGMQQLQARDIQPLGFTRCSHILFLLPHTQKGQSHPSTCYFRNGEAGKKNIHNLHIEGLFHKGFFVRPRVKGRVK